MLQGIGKISELKYRNVIYFYLFFCLHSEGRKLNAIKLLHAVVIQQKHLNSKGIYFRKNNWNSKQQIF